MVETMIDLVLYYLNATIAWQEQDNQCGHTLVTFVQKLSTQSMESPMSLIQHSTKVLLVQS